MVKDDDEEPAKPPKPILPPQILMQIDVAEAAGLMTHSPSMASKNLPSWCTDDFCESVRRSQVKSSSMISLLLCQLAVIHTKIFVPLIE